MFDNVSHQHNENYESYMLCKFQYNEYVKLSKLMKFEDILTNDENE